jgi:TonB family protein
MIPAPTIANLGLFVLQAALLIGALALTVAALRPGPALRLAACRGLLLLLLLLPLQVWLRDAPVLRELPVLPAGGAVVAVDAIDVHALRGLSWPVLVAAVIACGVAARLLWLGAGLVRLRRLARDLPDGQPAGVEAEVADLQALLATRARVAFVDRVAQPVTFGIAPPIVLLPASLLAAPVDRRRAILCHELLHVRRRDWLWVIGEELALTVLWFHPAAWWLIGELQLAREQVVDRLTVAATGARREYMDALFSAADLPSAPPLLSGFLRRRHLARRLVSLAEEVVMSRSRLVVAAVSMVMVLVGGAAVGLAAWPLAPMPSAAQEPHKMAFQPRMEEGVRVERRTDVSFPNAGVEPRFSELFVDVDATVDAAGDVTAAKAATVTLHGPFDTREGWVDAAVASAVDAIREWRFEAPTRTPASVLVRVRFAAETRQASIAGVTPVKGYIARRVLRPGQPPKKLVNVQPIYPQEAQDAKVTGVVVVDMILDGDGTVHEAWVTQSVPMLDQAALDAVRQWKFEPTLLNGAPVPVRITVSVNFSLAP